MMLRLIGHAILLASLKLACGHQKDHFPEQIQGMGRVINKDVLCTDEVSSADHYTSSKRVVEARKLIMAIIQSNDSINHLLLDYKPKLHLMNESDIFDHKVIRHLILQFCSKPSNVGRRSVSSHPDTSLLFSWEFTATFSCEINAIMWSSETSVFVSWWSLYSKYSLKIQEKVHEYMSLGENQGSSRGHGNSTDVYEHSAVHPRPTKAKCESSITIDIPVLSWVVRIHASRDMNKARMVLQLMLAVDSIMSRIVDQFKLVGTTIFQGFILHCTRLAKDRIEKWVEYVQYIQKNHKYKIQRQFEQYKNPDDSASNSTQNEKHSKRKRAYDEVRVNFNKKWHLVRTSNRENQRDSKSKARVLTNPYRKVFMYIMDTGIDATHQEIRPYGINKVISQFYQDTRADETRLIHGTGVASVAVGATIGVAPFARLMDFSPAIYDDEDDLVFETASVLLTMQKILQDFDDRWRSSEEDKPAAVVVVCIGTNVVNEQETAIHDAVDRLREKGITVVAAAGGAQPGEDPDSQFVIYGANAFFVGSTTKDDEIHSFCPKNRLIKLYAPGEDLRVARAYTKNQFIGVTGTSLSAPIVAGIMANILGNPDFRHLFGTQVNVQDLHDITLCAATIGKLHGLLAEDLQDDQNLLAYNIMTNQEIQIESPLQNNICGLIADKLKRAATSSAP